MWQTTTSPPWRRRRARAWVRRSSRSSWLASPVCGSAMESCQSWSYFPRGGPPDAGRLGPGRAELLQHRLDALGRAPAHGRRSPRGLVVPAEVPATSELSAGRPRQVSSWLPHAIPLRYRPSHSYRNVAGRNRAGSHQVGLQTCRSRSGRDGQLAPQPDPTPGAARSPRAGHRRLDTWPDQGKGTGQSAPPPAPACASLGGCERLRRRRAPAVAASDAGPPGPAPSRKRRAGTIEPSAPAEKTRAAGAGSAAATAR